MKIQLRAQPFFVEHIIMSPSDDETLKAYIDESLEHLAGIETDLLEMEKAGSNIDVEKVNTVFRAAHSIKGGAGFIGLENIKTLSHHMESVLGLIRNKKLVPNPENINFLLLASDTLKNLLVHVEESDGMDISEHVGALSSITDHPEPSIQEPASKLRETPVFLSFPDSRPGLTASPDDLEHIRDMKQEGRSVYLLEIPLTHDTQDEGKPCDGVLEEARSYGTVLTHQLDQNQPPHTLTILFACILDPEDVANLFEMDPDRVYEVSQDGRVLLPNHPLQTRAEDHSIPTAEPVPDNHIEHPPPTTEPLEPSPIKAESQPNPTPTETHTPIPETSLRVQVGVLDSLMTLAGELVLTRNQLLQAIPARDFRSSEIIGKRIDIITSELQETIMLRLLEKYNSTIITFQ